MSAEDYVQAIAALDRVEREHNRALETARAAAQQPANSAPAGIRMLDADPLEVQRLREGEFVLAAMERAGIGSEWMSGGELMGGNR